MKTVVVYDSKFGNTERLARTIAQSLTTEEAVPVVSAAAATARNLSGVELLVVGGATQAHGLSPALRTFLDGLPAESVRHMAAATFDTRLTWPRFLAGSAAAAAAKRLQKKGATLVIPAESFLVKGSEGPLVEGELERARTWAARVRAVTGLPEGELVGALL